MDVKRFKRFMKHVMERQLELAHANGNTERTALTPIVWGRHGIGKSSMFWQTTRELDVGYVDLRPSVMEVGDLIGLPERAGDRTVWLKPEWFPHPRPADVAEREARAYEERAKSSGVAPEYAKLMARNIREASRERGILVVEEINRAQRDVRQALFQLVWDHRLHTHPLPQGWVVVCTANPPGMDYEVADLDDAFLDRLIHVTFTPSKEDWVEHATRQKIDDRVRSLVQINPYLLGNEAADVPQRRPSPRAWFVLSALLKGLDEEMVFEVASGCVGKESALALIESMKQRDRPINGEDILERYTAGLRGVVQRYADPAQARLDLLKATGDNVIATLRLMGEADTTAKLTPEQKRNLERFVLDLPPDYAMTIVKAVSHFRELKFAYDAFKDNKELVERLIAVMGWDKK